METTKTRSITGNTAKQKEEKTKMKRQRKGKLEIYPDAKGEWRWRLKAANGEVVASGEGYSRKDYVRGLQSKIAVLMREATVVELDEE